MAIHGKSVAFLVSKEGIEQAEMTEPWKAVEQAGGTPRLISEESGTVQAFNHLTPADTFTVDQAAADAQPDDFSAVVLPGGVANGDRLRMQPHSKEFLSGFLRTGRPLAVICHGGWILIELDAVRGRRITSWPSLATDYRNAGADWVDEQVVVDTNGSFPMVSSRKPDDLPAFCKELVSQLERM